MVGPKIVVITQSCKRDRNNGAQQMIRETWMREWGHLDFTHRFVLGEGNFDPAADEIIVETPDGYFDTPWKTREAIRHAYIGLTADFVFHSAVDTYVHVPRLLMNSDFTRAGYIGLRCDEGHASGGAGYWLNRRAMEIVSSATPYSGPEDLWVGTTLLNAGIELTPDTRYRGCPQDMVDWAISIHLGRGTGDYDPMWMAEVHAIMRALP